MKFINQQQFIYILLVSLVFIYFCFLFPRNQILEGLTEIKPGIQSVFENRRNLGLSQYMIMASSDSAYDGFKITNEQLLQVITTGCRFFDFQVFYDDPVLSYNGYMSRPYIGFSNGEKVLGVDSNHLKRLTLNKVLTTIAASCFGTVAPNILDPVFIHLRIKSSQDNVYDLVAEEIQSTIASRLYTDTTGKAMAIHKDTPFQSIMGKIIIVIDRSINPDYLPLSQCPAPIANTTAVQATNKPCVKLSQYVNIESGGSFWRTITYNPPNNVNDMTKGGLASPIVDERTQSMGILIANNSNVDLYLVIPPIDSNPDIISTSTYISDLGCQTVMFRFYIHDNNLTWYKGIFEIYKTAFIPMGFAISSLSTKTVDTARVLL